MDLAVQPDADGRWIDADLDRLEIGLGHVDRGSGRNIRVTAPLSLRERAGVRVATVAGFKRRRAGGQSLDQSADGKHLAVVVRAGVLRDPLRDLGQIDPRPAVVVFTKNLQAGRRAHGQFNRAGLNLQFVRIDRWRGRDLHGGLAVAVLEVDQRSPHARQADRAGGLVEPGHARFARDADDFARDVLLLEEALFHQLAIDAGANRTGELGGTGDQGGRPHQPPAGSPQQQQQQQEGQGGDLPVGLALWPGLEQARATRAAGALAGTADEQQVAVRIGADDRGGRFVVQPLVAPAPDQPPVAQHVAIAEEVAVQVGAGRIVDQFLEGPQENLAERAFRGRFPFRLFEPLPQLGQVIAKQPLQVLGRGRLADHVFQPPSLVVADIEADGLFLPHGFGNHPPQPAEEDAVIRPRTVEHGYPRFDGDRPIIAGCLRQINTYETSSHS